ncbi:MAG: hypothetical protein WBJ21_01515 [Burkholderiaceae bacterium]
MSGTCPASLPERLKEDEADLAEEFPAKAQIAEQEQANGDSELFPVKFHCVRLSLL